MGRPVEASGGELVGVHLENSKEGVGVIIFLVPVERGGVRLGLV